MTRKIMLFACMSALALNASAGNVITGGVRGASRTPNAVTKSAFAKAASTDRIGVGPSVFSRWTTASGVNSDGLSFHQPNAIGRQASPMSAESNVSAVAVNPIKDHRRGANAEGSAASITNTVLDVTKLHWPNAVRKVGSATIASAETSGIGAIAISGPPGPPVHKK